MTLRLLPGPEERARQPKPPKRTATPPTKGRQLAPNAPMSPGTAPLDVAKQLRTGEVLLWWNEKNEMSWKAIIIAAICSLTVILIATWIAPSFWLESFSNLWKPLAAITSPPALIFIRERYGQRAIAVTDSSVIDVPMYGRPDRVAVRNVRRVRTDLLTGGVMLQGKEHKVRIPSILVFEAQKAIFAQTKGTIRPNRDEIDDPLGWLP